MPQKFPQAASLGRILDTLGTDLLTPLASPQGLDVPVTDAVVHDPLLPGHPEAGDLLLAVGVAPDSPEARELVASGAVAAVVFKVDDGCQHLADAARVAVLGTRPDISWGRLLALLQTAIAGSGAVEVGDLFALADAIAASVGGPAVITDQRLRTLAYSNLAHPIDDARLHSIVDRRPLDKWMRRAEADGLLAKLNTAVGVLRVDQYTAIGMRPRLAAPVRAGGEVLGYIWVIEGDTPFTGVAQAALVESASIAALHLIRHRLHFEVQRHEQAELLLAFLDGRGPGESLSGFADDERVTVVAFAIGEADETELLMNQERALTLIELHAQSLSRRALCAATDDCVYVLIPWTGHRERLVSLAEVTVHRLHELGLAARAGIGSTVNRLRDASQSRLDADDVLRVIPADCVVGTIEEWRARIAVQAVVDETRDNRHIRSEPVEKLLAHDAERGTSYATTLRALLDAFGDIGKAAKALNVHHNTLRYRLERVGSISGLDLSDPDARFAADVVLRRQEPLPG